MLFLTLLISSAVLRDMLRHCNEGKEIRLCDESLESAENIKALLNLIYYAKSPTLSHLNGDVREIIALINLLRKYECDMALNCIKQNIELRSHRQDGHSLSVFIIAAVLQDVRACAQAISAGGTWSWTDAKAATVGNDVESAAAKCRLFDLTGIPYFLFELIPLRYAHTLLRATRISPPTARKGSDWKQISAEFKRLMAQLPGEHIDRA